MASNPNSEDLHYQELSKMLGEISRLQEVPVSSQRFTIARSVVSMFFALITGIILLVLIYNLVILLSNQSAQTVDIENLLIAIVSSITSIIATVVGFYFNKVEGG